MKRTHWFVVIALLLCLQLRDSTSQTAQCGSGQFFNSLTKRCEECIAGCQVCSAGTTCSKCVSGYLLSATSDQCIRTCASGFYADLSSQRCSTCHPSCQSCYGATSSNCLTCPTNTYLSLGSCLSSCATGYFAELTSLSCQICDFGCKTCVGASTACTSCPPGLFLSSGTCIAACPPGFYHDQTSWTCTACHPSCAKCTGTASTQCFECNTNYYLDGTTCATSCLAGKYSDATTKRCLICPTTKRCSQCSDVNTCTACYSGFSLNAATKSCDPVCGTAGQYQNTSVAACQPCNSLCASCYDEKQTTCFTCSGNAGVVGYDTTCDIRCPAGMYASAAKCLLCDTTCTACATSATSCSSCAVGYFLSSSTCVRNCPDGFYGDFTTSRCLACDARCLRCFGDGGSRCTQCTSSYILYGTSCVQACPTGYYANTVTGRCVACYAACTSCTGPASTQCSGCVSQNGYLLETAACKVGTSCTTGRYANWANGTCDTCDVRCRDCYGGDFGSCYACNSGYFLELRSSSCSRSCQTLATYGDTTASLCARCDYACLSCLGPTTKQCSACRTDAGYVLQGSSCVSCHVRCTRCFGTAFTQCTGCAPGYFLSGTSCVADCPTGTFQNPSTSTCDSCPNSCASCTSTSSTACTSCNDGFVYSNGQCIACDASCQTCSSSSSNGCLTCKDGFNLNPTTNSCLATCTTGFTSYNRTCIQCDLNCQQCFGSGQRDCLTCAGQYARLDGTCRTGCDNGYYLFGSRCGKCNAACNACFGPTNRECSACSSGYLQHEGETICSSQCERGFYRSPINSNLCVRCKTGCGACPDGSVLFKEVCVKQCPTGTTSADGMCKELATTQLFIAAAAPASPVSLLFDLQLSATAFNSIKLNWAVIDPSTGAEINVWARTVRDQPRLFLPRENIDYGRTYRVTVQATAADGSQSQANVSMTTATPLTVGTIVVSPMELTSFSDVLTVSLNGFLHSLPLFYDVIAYVEATEQLQVMGELRTVRSPTDVLIFLSGQSMSTASPTTSFKFPARNTTSTYKVQVRVYNSLVRYVQTYSVLVKAVADWTPVASILTSPAFQASLGSVISWNYNQQLLSALAKDEEFFGPARTSRVEVTRLLQAARAATGPNTTCDGNLTCSGNGQCTSTGTLLGKCSCNIGFAGRGCSIPIGVNTAWRQTMTPIQTRLASLSSILVDETTYGPVLQFLEALTATQDILAGNELASIVALFKQVVPSVFAKANPLVIEPLQRLYAHLLFHIAGADDLLSASTRNDLLAQTQSHYDDLIRNLVPSLSVSDGVFAVASPLASSVFIVLSPDDVARLRVSASTNNLPLSTRLNSTAITLPMSLFPTNDKSIVKVDVWQVQSFGLGVQSIRLFANGVSLSLFDGDVEVTNYPVAAPPLTISLGKLAVVGPLSAGAVSCASLQGLDTEFQGRCSLLSESATNVDCSCMSFGSYAAFAAFEVIANKTTLYDIVKQNTFTSNAALRRISSSLKPQTSALAAGASQTTAISEPETITNGIGISLAVILIGAMIIVLGISKVLESPLPPADMSITSVGTLSFAAVPALTFADANLMYTTHSKQFTLFLSIATQMAFVAVFFQTAPAGLAFTSLEQYLMPLYASLASAAYMYVVFAPINHFRARVVLQTMLREGYETLAAYKERRTESTRRLNAVEYPLIVVTIAGAVALLVLLTLRMDSALSGNLLAAVAIAIVIDLLCFDALVVVLVFIEKKAKRFLFRRLFNLRGYSFEVQLSAQLLDRQKVVDLLTKRREGGNSLTVLARAAQQLA